MWRSKIHLGFLACTVTKKPVDTKDLSMIQPQDILFFFFFFETKQRTLIKKRIIYKGKRFPKVGQRNLNMKNIALLGIWLWIFPLEQDALWPRVIRSTYGLQSNGWDLNLVTRESFRNPWKLNSQGLNSFLRNVKILF